MSNLETGARHSEVIGYFVVREEDGSAEIEVQDAPPLESREEAEQDYHERGASAASHRTAKFDTEQSAHLAAQKWADAQRLTIVPAASI